MLGHGIILGMAEENGPFSLEGPSFSTPVLAQVIDSAQERPIRNGVGGHVGLRRKPDLEEGLAVGISHHEGRGRRRRGIDSRESRPASGLQTHVSLSFDDGVGDEQKKYAEEDVGQGLGGRERSALNGIRGAYPQHRLFGMLHFERTANGMWLDPTASTRMMDASAVRSRGSNPDTPIAAVAAASGAPNAQVVPERALT
jgi:hypothetical protein